MKAGVCAPSPTKSPQPTAQLMGGFALAEQVVAVDAVADVLRN
jgi:hypothetical protein